MTHVMGSEISSGPLLEASYTAESPRNQLQHAPQKPKSLPCDSVNVVTCVESRRREMASQLVGRGWPEPAAACGTYSTREALTRSPYVHY